MFGMRLVNTDTTKIHEAWESGTITTSSQSYVCSLFIGTITSKVSLLKSPSVVA